MKVSLYLANGFEEIEAITVADILRRADIHVQLVSIMEDKEVIGAHNIKIVADDVFENVDHLTVDMMILPGGGGGTQHMADHAGLKQQLLKQATENKWIAAICAAPTVLGKLGLLAGKSATCYPGCESQLTGAKVSTSPNVIVDGKVITSRGPGTSSEFGLKIVEVLKNLELATQLKKQMIIE